MYTDIVKSITDKITSNIKVCLPAVIEKYDFKKQKANVRIDLQELYNNDTYIEYPILCNLPVIHSRSGGASITLPVSVGDSCLIIFSHRDISNWLAGNSKQKPNSRRMHHIKDAVVFMGLMQFNKNSDVTNAEQLLIQYSSSQISLEKNGIVNITTAKQVHIKTETIQINAKHAHLTTTENVVVHCKDAEVKANNDLNIQCKNANLTGDLKITGLLEVSKTAKISGKLTTEAGIENSGGNLVSSGKTFETHTHNYQDVTQVVAPNGACTVTKTPSNTGATN